MESFTRQEPTNGCGFRNPWFKAVLKIGWDFIGRVRGLTKYTEQASDEFEYCEKLHRKATVTHRIT